MEDPPQAEAIARAELLRECKRDGLGRVEELRLGDGVHLARRLACGGRVPGSRFAARTLARREARALRALAGLEGVARVVAHGDAEPIPDKDGCRPRRRDVFLRSWIDGEPLYAATSLPRDFFDRLRELVEAMHGRGVCHNDLHKENNIVVGPGGEPRLIDFQLASVHDRRGRTFRTRSKEDLRHVEKHRRRYENRGVKKGSSNERSRRSLLASLWLRSGKPVYRFVTRRLMRYDGGEPRRPSAGPWPEWGPPLNGDAGNS